MINLKLLMLDEISLIGHRVLTFVDRKLTLIKHVHNILFCGNLDAITIQDFFNRLFMFVIHWYLNWRTMVLTLWAWTFGKIK
jgi:hypothetical protein